MLLNIFFLFYLIKLSLTVVPVWNFKSSAIDLLTDKNSYKDEYLIANRSLLGLHFSLKRILYLDNEGIKQEYYLSIDGSDYRKVDYEDIESAYRNLDGGYYVCPRGKFNVYSYPDGTSKDFSKYDVNNNEINWNLSCYLQYNGASYNDNSRTLFFFYLGKGFEFYQHNFKDFIKSQLAHEGIYAYKWRISTTNDEYGSYKQMVWIIKKGNKIVLDYPIISFGNNNEFEYNGNNNICADLDVIKSDFLASFFEGSYNFFWINYNKDNITDFSSGHNALTDQILDKYNNVIFKNYHIIKNETTPFEFLDHVTIESINYIYGKKYAYYKLNNNDKNINYYGVYDVLLNKVIFNTDENLLEF